MLATYYVYYTETILHRKMCENDHSKVLKIPLTVYGNT